MLEVETTGQSCHTATATKPSLTMLQNLRLHQIRYSVCIYTPCTNALQVCYFRQVAGSTALSQYDT